MIAEGFVDRRQYEKQSEDEVKHLLRYLVTIEINKSRAAEKKKQIELSDVFPIPEIDSVLEKARKEYLRRQEERDRAVYQKYKNLEGV